MATSQRLLGFAIAALLVAGIATAVVKGSDEEPITLPTRTAEPSPTETFTFPGPVPTETETGLFPTETETPAGPDVSPTEDELPRTGNGSMAWAALVTLGVAVAGAALVRLTARSVS